MELETIAKIASPIVAVGGLVASWLKWRDSALRRDEVAAWSSEVIRAMQSLLLITILREPVLDPTVAKSKLTEVIFDTSVLIERGRIFFRNQRNGTFGEHKQPAYRGFRPLILDPIVVAYQVACAWSAADDETRLRLRCVAEDSLKKFVSLAQMEVGRSRSASADTSKGGDGIHLPSLLAQVPEQTLAKIRRRPA
jgi:hypothetical protein